VEQIRLIAIRDTALSVDEVRSAIADPAAGGEVLFVGTVRDNDAEKGVTGLSYSAHPSAEKERSTAPATWPSATWRSWWACPARTGPRPSTRATR
jgi:molybdopterin synthase catalytic subunit